MRREEEVGVLAEGLGWRHARDSILGLWKPSYSSLFMNREDPNAHFAGSRHASQYIHLHRSNLRLPLPLSH